MDQEMTRGATRSCGRLGHLRLAALTILALFASVLLAGCWDRVELGERLYALTVGLDQPLPETSPGGGGGESPRYRVAIEIAIWRSLRQGPSGDSGAGGGGQGGGGVGGPKDKPAWILASTSDSVGEALDNLRNRSYRPISLAQLKVVVLGEGVARRGIDELLDFLERNQEVQRRVRLAVAQGDALEVLRTPVVVDQLVGFVLPRFIRAGPDFGRVPAATLGEAMAAHEGKQSFAVPRVRTSGHELVVEGAGVLRGDRLAGWLDGRESRGLAWATGHLSGGIIEFPCLIRRGEHHSVRAAGGRRAVKVRLVGGRPVFRLSVTTRVDLLESSHHVESLEVVRKVETAVAGVIREEIDSALAAGKRYRADVFGFGQALRLAEPDFWDKVKDHWDDYFAREARVEVTEVRARVRHVGQIR